MDNCKREKQAVQACKTASFVTRFQPVGLESAWCLLVNKWQDGRATPPPELTVGRPTGRALGGWGVNALCGIEAHRRGSAAPSPPPHTPPRTPPPFPPPPRAPSPATTGSAMISRVMGSKYSNGTIAHGPRRRRGWGRATEPCQRGVMPARPPSQGKP